MNQTPEELARKIEEARARESRENPAPEAPSRDGKASVGQGLRAATDLVAGVGVGTFLGYWIDQWLGTTPGAMIILLFLGFAAGLLNIYRAETGQDFTVGFKKDTKEKKE